jgi:SAM-dependent methyltransferase
VSPGPDPDVESAKERAWQETAAIDAALERGEIDEDGWHAAVLALVEPAYLAATTPQLQSGHSGDAASWEYSRRLVMDAVDRDGTFLDVGCANGLLMESVARWGTEDGRVVEPYGVDISASLAHLARDRCPQWADRIWSANAASWRPPRRFTYVRTGLEYVPTRSRPAYVDHLLTFLEPGGRLILGKHNEETDRDDLAASVVAAGHPIAGRATRAHAHPALTYKVCWVDA